MKRTEIWRVNLDPTVGQELQKTRPSIIVGNDDVGVLPLKVIVPITAWKERYHSSPWMVKIEPSVLKLVVKNFFGGLFSDKVSVNRPIYSENRELIRK